MKWYEKFKINQEVKVVKKVFSWKYGYGCSWNSEGDMDITIGKVYRIVKISKDIGYQLLTKYDTHYKHNYWYPAESLQALVGIQLEFDFMNS